MARNPESVQIGQDALIIAHPESGQFVAGDFEHEGQVGMIAHRLHELNALTLFGAINQREMFYSYQQQVAVDRYKDRAAEVLAGSKRIRDDMQSEARDEFYRSRGVFAVLQQANDFPNFDTAQYLREVKREWGLFQVHYRSERHASARSERIKSLRAGILTEVTSQHRQDNERPYFTSKRPSKKTPQPRTEDYPVLSSRERLVALRDDARAGFIPKNDREKIKCFTFLDYLDNPEYPLGVTNQLIEVFIHQQKTLSSGKLAVAQKSVISITHEIHDHLTDALGSREVLVRLEQDLDGANPTLMVTDDVPVDHPGIAALVRFKDIQDYRDGSTLSPDAPGNPLKAIEDRREHDDATKNKTVGDVYTGTTRPVEMQAYITGQASELSIKNARKLLKQAIANETLAAAFWDDRLSELSTTMTDKDTLPVAALAGRLLLARMRDAS